MSTTYNSRMQYIEGLSHDEVKRLLISTLEIRIRRIQEEIYASIYDLDDRKVITRLNTIKLIQEHVEMLTV